MTVITKPNTILKKAQLKWEAEAAAAAATETKSDNTVIYFDDEKLPPAASCIRTTRRVVVFLVSLAALVGLGMCAYLMYQQCSATTHRYRTFCAVAVPRDQSGQAAALQANVAAVPALRWSSGPEPDVQVFSTMDDAARELVTFLRESLEFQDDVEKITVFDNGKHVNFIHDFTDNTTNIIDMERCFSMELEPEFILSPDVFTLSIERDERLDTSVVRGVWRAALPPARRPLCRGKPAYTLTREPAVRKRSTDEPSHEYLHFAGNHVMAIAIDNLAEIKEYESKLNKN